MTTLGCVLLAAAAHAQQTIARMPVADAKVTDAKVTGAVEIQGGEMRLASGSGIAAGELGAKLRLDSGGELNVCADSSVHVASGANAGELMLSLDRGAMELRSTLGQFSDVVITPDLRVLVSGPGAADVKIRVNQQGDTCVDNGSAKGEAADAPYVTVTEQLGAGVYRVQAGQRVMLEHGSVSAVVDHEKEPCGCPPAAPISGPEFPLAQSEGLAAGPPAATQPAVPAGQVHAQVTVPFVYNGSPGPPEPAPAAAVPPAKVEPAPAPKPVGKHPWLAVRHFFGRIFGGKS
jgi:hypothetical protein